MGENHSVMDRGIVLIDWKNASSFLMVKKGGEKILFHGEEVEQGAKYRETEGMEDKS